MILAPKEHAVKKSRDIEEQIAYALAQAETGARVAGGFWSGSAIGRAGQRGAGVTF